MIPETNKRGIPEGFPRFSAFSAMFPRLFLQPDAGIDGGDVPRCCGGLGANRIPAVFQNNWIEAILIDYYLGESTRRSRRFRASGNKNITLAYLCIALSLTEEHNKSVENVKSDKQTTDQHLLQ